jgi:hypothetical protein
VNGGNAPKADRASLVRCFSRAGKLPDADRFAAKWDADYKPWLAASLS